MRKPCLEGCFAPASVLDVRERAGLDYLISPQDILNHEELFGKIEEESFLLALTGWSQYWHDSKKYRAEDSFGQKYFPGFSKEAGELLLERGVIGIGIDTLSPDGSCKEFPIHQMFLSKNLILIENLTNLEFLPKTGAFLSVMPLKIRRGTESPVRAFGWVP